MGFLDHSTNNIIVDAVLTDLGRQALAKNDGSFNVYQFGLGDDECDYNVIQQFGRTVGKEKIEKNTPIIEALTAGSVALRHKLLSVSNEFLTHLPVLEFADTSTIALSRGGNVTTSTLTATISSKTGVGIDQDLIDGEFRVEVNHMFLGLTGEAPDIVHTDNIAIYRYPAGFGDTADTVSASIQLFLKSFSDTTFDTFSTSGGTYIRTFVKVTGINSGLTQNIEVQIEKGSS
jgi:hypothetical protein